MFIEYFLEHFNTLDDKQNIAFTNNYIFTREPNAGMVYDCENCEDSSLTAQTLTHKHLIGPLSDHNALQFHKDGVSFKTASTY